ncbi:MAG: DnaJ domain-containing protein, partial [Methylovirgula sp.]
MRDPYTVLGVTKSADMAEVKKAYRRLAKKFHPDQSKDPKAKDKFAEVSSAYEILGDEKKRAQFDRGEIDAEGKPRFQGFEGFGAGAGPGGFTRRAGPGGFE